MPTERISEVAFWCSLHTLSGFHQDSPDEARRRELFKDACRLMDGYHERNSLLRRLPNWLRRHLPSERRWTRAMTLLGEADPDSLAPLEHQLRTSALAPAESIGNIQSEERRHEIVDSVIKLRSSLINAHLAGGPTIAPSRPQGRLLLYVPDENVADGASRYASNGFFDPYDCPPWDLWLQYSDRTLISWVPEVLFPLAQAGIDANPIDCIRWAD
jgi:hypothetical protein